MGGAARPENNFGGEGESVAAKWSVCRPLLDGGQHATGTRREGARLLPRFPEGGKKVVTTRTGPHRGS